VAKTYDTVNKLSTTREYQRQKERESYRRHKTVPDRQFGVYLTPEEVKANQKRWYQEHREELLKRQAAYNRSAAGKAAKRRNEHHRRAVIGIYTEEQLQARIDFYGRRCYLCGCDWDALPSKQKHIEHVIPLSRGGTNWPANLRPACEPCNLKKGLAKLAL
jgi:5-methylcytosine-specific restriction endonuclease McrA